MALTQSKPASIFTPEGNSLAVFIDVNDGELKLKDVFGGVELFSDFISGGGAGLKLKDDALMTATLTEVADKDNTASALLLSTDKVKAESSEQCPLEIESTGTGGGIALLDNTTTNNTSVGVGALGDNLCFRSGGVAQGTARLFSTGNLVIGSTLSDSGFQIETEDRDASFFGVRVGRGNGGISTNTAVGASALNSNTSGSGNVALGLQALPSNTIGASNVGIGFSALLANTEGASNIGVGTNALNANATGNFNTVVGTQSAIGITTGSNNVVFGTFAIPTLNGSNNTILGYNTGQGITTGSNNTILGANVAGLSSTLNNNVIIADGSGNQRVVIDGSGNVGLNNGTSTTQATSVIRSLGTNSGIALVPNGTGAITANIPDGTATGGNARGNNAVDLQSSRTANTNIASGQNTVISGGSTNTASSNFSTISGGQLNTASTGTHATVVGGQSNTSSGAHSVSGGFSNTASGQFSHVGGRGNVSSGTNSFVIGTRDSTASGAASAVIAAEYSGATAYCAAVIASYNSSAGATNSMVIAGDKGISYLLGQLVQHGQPLFINSSAAQTSSFSVYRNATLSSGGTAKLSLDGTGITNLILPNISKSWNVTVRWIANNSSRESAIGTDTFFYKRDNSTVTGVISPITNVQLFQEASMVGAICTYSLGVSPTLDLQINFVAPPSALNTVFNIIAKVEIVELALG